MDSGVKQAHVFIGRDSLVADVYPMKSGKQFVNTLEDNVRRQGEWTMLLSDSAKTEISNKVMDILRAYHISSWHSKPYLQNQNPAECQHNHEHVWCSCKLLVSLNYIACSALSGSIPLLVLYSITADISLMLLYTFYQAVFYDQHFPSESEE